MTVSSALLVATMTLAAVCVFGWGGRFVVGRAAAIIDRDRLGARGRQTGSDGSAEGTRPAQYLFELPGVSAVVRLVTASRGAGRARAAAIELIAGLATELSTGAAPPVALDRAARASPVPICRHALAAARFGGDVARALDRDAAEGRLPSLGALAALWRVSHNSGAGMAHAAHRLARAEASAEAVRRELAAQLAGPKASARVLAGLPVFGMLLGAGLGASPVAWLLGSPIGLLVLLAGLALEVAGLLWVRRLVRSVEALL